MANWLIPLSWLNLFAWGVVLIFMGAGGAFSLRRHGDPARLVCFGFALIMVLGFGRRVFDPLNDAITVGVFLLAAVWAVLTLLASVSYGRGNIR